ncbi:MAG: hypothetical protein ACOZIN_22310 [Myxococcota bacterium]
MSVCARCPKVLGSSCCESAEGEALATLTDADLARIAAHTGWAVGRFAEVEWLGLEEARRYEELRPLFRGYFRQGQGRWTLRRVPVGDGRARCVFLHEARGCQLSLEVRPTACLLYPFERYPDGSWSVAVARHGALETAREEGGACLAVEEASSMDEVLAAFGLDRARVEALGERLRIEVDSHGKRKRER